ncbi:hypothetical protein KP509_26G042800 [Ceratopteris richardii]|uniref:Fe2OG dioxygenase domain-containing protein n=2 Tax=Ceratopteris richardii TaxID=49495 RepID=A0A8T2RMQ0_CERRI|nr:hypothetical protein KP509_26G042800 [Ceratopteris richardii]
MDDDIIQIVPVLDLSNLSPSQLQQKIPICCSEWGVFQIINHGVPLALQTQIRDAARHFFSLPTEVQRELLQADPFSPLSVFTGLKNEGEFRNWKRTLGFKPNPYMNTNLLPCILREPFLNFREKVGSLAHGVAKEIFAGLQLNADLLSDIHTRRQTMTVNYYPPCPERNFTYGIRPHSDFGSITLLMQDEVKGLQIRKGGNWIDMNPRKDAFIVMIGDQIEILTNGMYKSVEHRVLTNRSIPRISIACFYAPAEDDVIGPLGKFMSKRTPLMYRAVKFGDYLNHGFSKPLNGKSNLMYSAIN